MSEMDDELEELNSQLGGVSGTDGGDDFDLNSLNDELAGVDTSRKSFSIFPKDTLVPVRITRSNTIRSKSNMEGGVEKGNKPMIDLEFTILSEMTQGGGRKIWDKVMLTKDNLTRYVLLITAIDMYDKTNQRYLGNSSKDMLGKRLWLKLNIDPERTYNGKTYAAKNIPNPWEGFIPIDTYTLPGVETFSGEELADPFAPEEQQHLAAAHPHTQSGAPLPDVDSANTVVATEQTPQLANADSQLQFETNSNGAVQQNTEHVERSSNAASATVDDGPGKQAEDTSGQVEEAPYEIGSDIPEGEVETIPDNQAIAEEETGTGQPERASETASAVNSVAVDEAAADSKDGNDTAVAAESDDDEGDEEEKRLQAELKARREQRKNKDKDKDKSANKASIASEAKDINAELKSSLGVTETSKEVDDSNSEDDVDGDGDIVSSDAPPAFK